MFVGQALVGFIYLVVWHRNRQQYRSIYEEKSPAPIWIVLFPALMDLLSTLLSYIALNLVASSVWQISRGGNIIFTALFSSLFLRRRFSRSAIIGCCLAFLGITSVQVVAVVANSGASGGGVVEQLIGIGLLLASILFNSCGLVFEKWIFNKYELHPLKMVFLEGIYGLIIMVPLTIGFQYINCPWDDKEECVAVGAGYYLEDINLFFNQVSSSLLLVLLNVGLILSVAISVPIAVTVSKSISPVSRSLADVCRTLFIWLFGIIMTLTYGQTHEPYQLEDTRVWVNVLKALGFLVLIVGTMMYHQMLPWLQFGRRRSDVQRTSESILESETDEGNQPLVRKV